MNRDDRRFLERVGFRVRERRAAAGLTQAELGERCGLHRTFVGSVERGERNAALLSLRRIAKALRTTPAALLAEPEALKAATSVAAKALHLSDSVGAVRAGMRTDLIAVEGDPTADIKVLWKVRLVMKDGVTYKSP